MVGFGNGDALVIGLGIGGGGGVDIDSVSICLLLVAVSLERSSLIDIGAVEIIGVGVEKVIGVGGSVNALMVVWRLGLGLFEFCFFTSFKHFSPGLGAPVLELASDGWRASPALSSLHQGPDPVLLRGQG